MAIDRFTIFPPLRGRSASSSPTTAGSTSGLPMTSAPVGALARDPLPDCNTCNVTELWAKEAAVARSNKTGTATHREDTSSIIFLHMIELLFPWGPRELQLH